MKKKITIVHSDDDLVIVDKPAGILSIPDRYDAKKENLLQFLRKIYPEVYTVHRLDQSTSGLICFARTRESHRHLTLQFNERSVKKQYLALVMGQTPQKGKIEAPIGERASRPGQMEVQAKGKASITEYKCLEWFQQHSLLEVNLITGRTHQVRVHLSHIGHPLVGDETYGGVPELLVSEIKGRRYRSNKHGEERPLLSRPALHARFLQLTHPGTGKKLEYTADPPKDIRASIQQLRKWTPYEPKH